MKPSRLAILAVLVLAASGVWAAGLLSPDPPAPQGALASDRVEVIVGSGSALALGGPQLGLLAGAALLIGALAWAVIRRRGHAAEHPPLTEVE